MESKILLAKKAPFAQGGGRKCYVHPHHPGRCLKIVKSEYLETIKAHYLKRKKQRWKFRGLLPRFLNPNIKNALAYSYLETLSISGAYKHIPRFYGFYDTDLGSALCVQLMRSADGSIAPTLQDRILQGADNSLKSALAEFTLFIRRLLAAVRLDSRIPAVYWDSFSPYNLLVVRLADGREKIYFAEYCHYDIGIHNLPFVKARRQSLKHLNEWITEHVG